MTLVADRVGHLMQDRSTLVLLLANIAALLAAIYWQWEVFDLMLLYWLETAVIGFFSIVKMLHRGGLRALFFVFFFCFHFGMFMFAHLVFLVTLFAGDEVVSSIQPNVLWQILAENVHLIILPAIALFGSHLYSFLFNYIGKREYEIRSIKYFFAYPYPRVVVMHITVILGGFVVPFFGPVYALIFLSSLKIFTDTIAHLEVHID